MGKNLQKNGFINLLVLLLVGISGFAVARSSNSLAGQICLVFIGIGLLVTVVSWFQMRLEERERVERLELEELSKGHAQSALFEARDAELFPAQRSREQFERFFIPIFTAGFFLGGVGSGVFFLCVLVGAGAAGTPPQEPMLGVALVGLF